MIIVTVDLRETSQSLTYEALNVYTKGPLLCIYCTDRRVLRFPLDVVWRVTERRADTSSDAREGGA